MVRLRAWRCSFTSESLSNFPDDLAFHVPLINRGALSLLAEALREFGKQDGYPVGIVGVGCGRSRTTQHPEAAMPPPRYPSDLSDEERVILEPLLRAGP